MNDFTPYIALREQGASPHEVYRAARANGLHYLVAIRMLRDAFGVDLKRAKEITVQADHGAASLSEYQERFIVPALKEVARILEEEEREAEAKRSKEDQP